MLCSNTILKTNKKYIKIMNPEHVITLTRVLLPYFILAITFYVCVSKPLQKQSYRDCFIKNQLKSECVITTIDGISGTVIRVLHHTVIIERRDGVKVEVLKQSIVDVRTPGGAPFETQGSSGRAPL